MGPFQRFTPELIADSPPNPTDWLVDVWFNSSGFRFEIADFSKGKTRVGGVFVFTGDDIFGQVGRYGDFGDAAIFVILDSLGPICILSRFGGGQIAHAF